MEANATNDVLDMASCTSEIPSGTVTPAKTNIYPTHPLVAGQESVLSPGAMLNSVPGQESTLSLCSWSSSSSLSPLRCIPGVNMTTNQLLNL